MNNIWKCGCNFTTFTSMKELVTIKVTVETARNFKGAAYLLNKKQYEVSESASEMFLQHVEKKNKKFMKRLESRG